MGGSQSARKLTINNEDGVIQISTDLVQRLTQSSREASAGVNLENPKPEPSKIADAPKPSSVAASRPVSPVLPPARPKQSHSDNTADLKMQQQQWQDSLVTMKLSEEVDKVLQEIKQKMSENKSIFEKDTPGSAACSSAKEKVINCYRANPREILRCSSAVAEFNNCVDQRVNMTAAQC